ISPSRIDSFFFSNSVAEATEAAVKLARHATGRPNVIVVQGGFHGRTYLTMGMTTSKVGVRAGYQPLPAGIFATTFPRPFAWAVDEQTAVDRALEDRGIRHGTRARRRRLSAGAAVVRAGRAAHLCGERDPVRRRRGADRLR